MARRQVPERMRNTLATPWQGECTFSPKFLHERVKLALQSVQNVTFLLSSPPMRRLAPFLVAALPAWAEPVAVPSGQSLEFHEALWELEGRASPILRLRFIAPDIGAGLTFADVEPDFLHLCRTQGLPRLTSDRSESTIIINMLDRPIPFGSTDPDAIQFFEAFRAAGGDCVWAGL